jgi:hypothetical protein
MGIRERKWAEEGGEMTQILYAHMNKRYEKKVPGVDFLSIPL